MQPIPYETLKSLQRERWRQAEEYRLARTARRARRTSRFARSRRSTAEATPTVVVPLRPRPRTAPETATSSWTHPPDAA